MKARYSKMSDADYRESVKAEFGFDPLSTPTRNGRRAGRSSPISPTASCAATETDNPTQNSRTMQSRYAVTRMIIWPLGYPHVARHRSHGMR